MNDEQALDALLQALGDPTRRRLLSLLRVTPGLTTGDLVNEVTGMTRWGVMKHLDMLRRVGLVQTFPEGRLRRHYLEPRPLAPLERWLAANADRSRRR